MSKSYETREHPQARQEVEERSKRDSDGDHRRQAHEDKAETARWEDGKKPEK
jgi:hypothetical protein